MNNTRQALTGLSKIAYLTLRFTDFIGKVNIENMLPFQNSSMMNIGNLEVECLLSKGEERTQVYCPPGVVTFEPSQLPNSFPHLQQLFLAGVYPSNNRTRLKFPCDQNPLLLPLNLSHFQFDSKEIHALASYQFVRTLSVTFTNRLRDITNLCPFTGSLQTISFMNNDLQFMPFNCFTPKKNESSELEFLDLSNNGLEYLKNNTFKRLTSLRMLYIANCQLKSLPVGLFDDLVHLKVLDLDRNNITFLQKGIFSKLVDLERLYMHNNSIQHIEYQSLPTYSDNLAFIDLRWNNLRTVPYDCLTLPNLYLCDCKGNKIRLNNLTEIIEHFDPIRMQLIKLYGHSYTSNRLGTLHEVVQSTIDLSDNKISGIDYSHAWPK